MNLDHLLSLVRRPEHLDGTHTADLEALLQEYPYFTAGHLLLLKAYKQQNSIHFKKQLRKVAAIAPDRAQVYALTEAWPEAESVVIDEMGEKLPEAEELVQAEPMSEGLHATVEVPVIAEDAEMPAQEETEVESLKSEMEHVAAVVSTAEEPEATEVAAESTAVASEEAAVVFAFDPAEDQVETASASTAALPDDQLLALVDELAALPTVETEENLPELELATDEEGALHFAFEPTAPAENQEQPAAEVTTATEEPAISESDMQLNTAPPAGLLAEEPAAEVEVTVAAESMVTEEPSDSQTALEIAIQAREELVAATSTAETKSEITEDYEVFVTHAHDRLSWFRFFAAKPLREQPDEVLEQLYMEHMQQDLLQAPAENPVEAIKVRVNTADEVPTSREMENEIKRLAYDSISDDELPASETLARIYEQQQEYKRAIKIYQKLILKFPDKMTYFAGLIEALRQK